MSRSSLTRTHSCHTVENQESAVKSIQEIGPFGLTHADVHDLIAGLSFLLSLSRLLMNGASHPGLMLLTALGVGRRLDPMMGFYMCGLHSHAGTVPTFLDSLGPDVNDDHVRILNIMYMSRHVLGGEGPSALASASPNGLFTISTEFRDPK